MVKETKRHMEKMAKKGKKSDSGPRNTNSSAKVFSNLQKIAADDLKRKEDKQKQRAGVKRSFNEANAGVSTRKYML